MLITMHTLPIARLAPIVLVLAFAGGSALGADKNAV
jgi:hypothetical protein